MFSLVGSHTTRPAPSDSLKSLYICIRNINREKCLHWFWFTYTTNQFLLTQQTSFYLHNKPVFTYTTNQFLLTQQTSFYLHNKPVFTNTTNQFLLTQQTSFYLRNKPGFTYTTIQLKTMLHMFIKKKSTTFWTSFKFQSIPTFGDNVSPPPQVYINYTKESGENYFIHV